MQKCCIRLDYNKVATKCNLYMRQFQCLGEWILVQNHILVHFSIIRTFEKAVWRFRVGFTPCLLRKYVSSMLAACSVLHVYLKHRHPRAVQSVGHLHFGTIQTSIYYTGHCIFTHVAHSRRLSVRCILTSGETCFQPGAGEGSKTWHIRDHTPTLHRLCTKLLAG